MKQLGNIFVTGDDVPGIYIYTPSSSDGNKLLDIVAKGLDRARAVWGQTSTLVGLLFGTAVQELGAQPGDPYGLSTRLGDFENSVLVVDDHIGRIGIAEGGKEPFCETWMTYDEFLQEHAHALTQQAQNV